MAADLWQTNQEQGGAPREGSSRAALNQVIEQALGRELSRRRDLPPHVQLGVRADAALATVEAAYARLSARYRPELFIDCGPSVIALAAQLSDLLTAAWTELNQRRRPAPGDVPDGRADSTSRALETIRGAVERRTREALLLRAAGDREAAIRAFEAVLELDPHSSIARAQLAELRRRDRFWPRLLARLARPFRSPDDPQQSPAT
ncbi:MAG TPA: hypothetical protein VE987_05055 [Polyangiaceae bacterium]|nr:hypothetical protein [Polyangiaceae bacterium]